MIFSARSKFSNSEYKSEHNNKNNRDFYSDVTGKFVSLYIKIEIGSSKGHFCSKYFPGLHIFLFHIQHEESAAFNKIK